MLFRAPVEDAATSASQPRTDPCIAGDTLEDLKTIGLSGTGASVDIFGR